MDTTTREQDIIKQVIQQYAQFKPSPGDIRLDTVFDDTQNRYALMQVSCHAFKLGISSEQDAKPAAWLR